MEQFFKGLIFSKKSQTWYASNNKQPSQWGPHACINIRYFLGLTFGSSEPEIDKRERERDGNCVRVWRERERMFVCVEWRENEREREREMVSENQILKPYEKKCFQKPIFGLWLRFLQISILRQVVHRTLRISSSMQIWNYISVTAQFCAWLLCLCLHDTGYFRKILFFPIRLNAKQCTDISYWLATLWRPIAGHRDGKILTGILVSF